jgi:sRNA-binding protein
MTTSPTQEISKPAAEAAGAAAPAPKPNRKSEALPVLERLFELYPHLFGVEFLPLKLGIFQELLAKHPDLFTREQLKTALAVHTRSTRYLQCVAAGNKRHDLQGAAVEDVAPEHVYQALVELFRRRQARTQEDLRPKLRSQLSAAFEASGLSRQDYLTRVQPGDEESAALLDEALQASAERIARQEALLKAFEASGKSAREFADMYGLHERDVNAMLARQRRAQAVKVKA